MSKRIKKISYRNYREIAYSFLKNVGVDRNSEFPFEIDLLADKAGYCLKPIPELKRDFGVKGVVIKKRGGGFEIGIDERHYMDDEMYFPFTIAEELGHILAHPYIYDEVRTVEDAIKVLCEINESDYRQMEQQARNVGSNILLPSFLFEVYVLDYCKNKGDEIRRKIFSEKEELAVFIAEGVLRKINISKWPIFYAILKRYPEPLLIDKIIDHFGLDLIF